MIKKHRTKTQKDHVRRNEYGKKHAIAENENALNGISNPERAGYTFVGWTTEAGETNVEYTAENLASAPIGATLYAIWLAESYNVQ